MEENVELAPPDISTEQNAQARSLLRNMFDAAMAAANPIKVLADHLPENLKADVLLWGRARLLPPWPQRWKPLGLMCQCKALW